VRGLERSGSAGFALEAPEEQLGITGHLGTDELDRRRPDQQAVSRPPDLAHPAATDLLLEDILAEFVGFGDLPAKSVGDPRGNRRQRGPQDAPEDGVEGHVLLLVARGEPGQERRRVMARDADHYGWQERQRREHHGAAGTRGDEDRPDHDGDGEGQQHLEDLTLVIPRHDGEETAGDNDAHRIDRPQAPPGEPGAAGQEPEQTHGRAGGDVAQGDGIRHDGDEPGAADQHHACYKENVESERDEEERLADERQALPDKIQPIRGVESPLQDGTRPGLGGTSRRCGHAERGCRHPCGWFRLNCGQMQLGADEVFHAWSSGEPEVHRATVGQLADFLDSLRHQTTDQGVMPSPLLTRDCGHVASEAD
jgi:hypothetical protein